MGSMSMGFKLQTINGLITAIVYCLEQKVLLDKLQSVWNADARLVAKLRQFDHITTTITYRCMHSTAPEYLTEMFMPVTDDPGRRHLRSAARGEWWHRCTTNKYQDVRPKKFCCPRTSHLERAFDLYPQLWTVAELFSSRTEDILFPQTL